MPQRHYVHGHHASVLRSHQWRTAENSAQYLLPHLRPGMDLLDLGCGPGTITADLARLVAPGRVVAVDSAPDVLTKAERACAERGVSNVEFVVSDAAALSLESDGFDVVHAHQVLQHVSDPVGVLGEMRRVCRPGGLVAARDSDYGAMTWFPEVPALGEWMALYQDMARQAGGEPNAGRRLKAWARAACFTDITASAAVWCYSSEEERAWWGGLWSERIRSSAIARQALNSGRATADDLELISEGWNRWADSPDAWFLVPHGEILCR
ncbi:methyltransferase domain-containing protein [Spiractinospora alimapuensis]|uniref:class I SAM-dependent methyltransferase n=1 Tax=Spiractinospora alimapuensis TaxID=2820884 RepID=UPI001F25C271|nr:methyltransferase domain-containing protein [Spiractinospora alimapuensis]QVQ52949.1 methyltransferase domain-containing protein [Spiractinospora alimapuensis]